MNLTVLIVFDFQYVGRFWTSYEAWLSMQTASKNGLHPSTLGEARFHITCVGAAERVSSICEETLKSAWHRRSPDEARAELSHSDILVTNQSDKQSQLEKLEKLVPLVCSICSGIAP